MKRFIKGIISIINQIWEPIKIRLILKLAGLIPYTPCKRLLPLKVVLLKYIGINIEGICFVDSGFKCLRPNLLTLGENVSLGHDNHIWNFMEVKIGAYTQTAKDLLIVAGSHGISNFEPLGNQEVEIGPGCWIGARVTILGGVKIGKGCVIGAGALVRDSLPDWSVAVGVPAQIIKYRQPSDIIWHQLGFYNRENLDRI